jgi:plastocyanin
MRPSRALVALLMLAALLLVACGDDSDSETEGGGGDGAATAPAETAPPSDASTNESAPSGEAVRSAKVEIVDFAYQPATVTIQAGGKVTWLNQDSEEHTATLDDGSFDSGELGEGKLKSQSFKEPGTFAYHCELHPEMTGTVEVVEAG